VSFGDSNPEVKI